MARAESGWSLGGRQPLAEIDRGRVVESSLEPELGAQLFRSSDVGRLGVLNRDRG